MITSNCHDRHNKPRLIQKKMVQWNTAITVKLKRKSIGTFLSLRWRAAGQENDTDLIFHESLSITLVSYVCVCVSVYKRERERKCVWVLKNPTMFSFRKLSQNVVCFQHSIKALSTIHIIVPFFLKVLDVCRAACEYVGVKTSLLIIGRRALRNWVFASGGTDHLSVQCTALSSGVGPKVIPGMFMPFPWTQPIKEHKPKLSCHDQSSHPGNRTRRCQHAFFFSFFLKAISGHTIWWIALFPLLGNVYFK